MELRGDVALLAAQDFTDLAEISAKPYGGGFSSFADEYSMEEAPTAP